MVEKKEQVFNVIEIVKPLLIEFEEIMLD